MQANGNFDNHGDDGNNRHPPLPHPKDNDKNIPMIQRRADDVLLGRGNIRWEGNQKFQTVIRHHATQYTEADSRTEKAQIVFEIVAIVHAWGGRFLCLDKTHSQQPQLQGKKKSIWVLADTTQIRKKVGQALRYQLAEQDKTCETTLPQQPEGRAQKNEPSFSKSDCGMEESKRKHEGIDEVAQGQHHSDDQHKKKAAKITTARKLAADATATQTQRKQEQEEEDKLIHEWNQFLNQLNNTSAISDASSSSDEATCMLEEIHEECNHQDEDNKPKRRGSMDSVDISVLLNIFDSDEEQKAEDNKNTCHKGTSNATAVTSSCSYTYTADKKPGASQPLGHSGEVQPMTAMLRKSAHSTMNQEEQQPRDIFTNMSHGFMLNEYNNSVMNHNIQPPHQHPLPQHCQNIVQDHYQLYQLFPPQPKMDPAHSSGATGFGMGHSPSHKEGNQNNFLNVRSIAVGKNRNDSCGVGSTLRNRHWTPTNMVDDEGHNSQKQQDDDSESSSDSSACSLDVSLSAIMHAEQEEEQLQSMMSFENDDNRRDSSPHQQARTQILTDTEILTFLGYSHAGHPSQHAIVNIREDHHI